jgi:hypothetical protein
MAIMSCGRCRGMILLLPRKRPDDDSWVRFIPDADTNIRELLGPNIPDGAYLIGQSEGRAA